ncbi:uncharacterized protein [Aegilops tauschii subsp. strangulata]|uniref:uncharacterized protein n=1 Tax=Aegilops tauschii subsp. strangulata TaxID=200361 RepID=UPI001E1C9E0C|nr:uncharacterized protein LOC123497003 isoform X1 [Aegilops tauschii subsp. strangulata]
MPPFSVQSSSIEESTALASCIHGFKDRWDPGGRAPRVSLQASDKVGLGQEVRYQAGKAYSQKTRPQSDDEELVDIYGQLWSVPSPRRARVSAAGGRLVWIRKDLFLAKNFAASDCHPAKEADKRQQVPKKFSFSKDPWKKESGRATYAEVVMGVTGNRGGGRRGGGGGAGRGNTSHATSDQSRSSTQGQMQQMPQQLSGFHHQAPLAYKHIKVTLSLFSNFMGREECKGCSHGRVYNSPISTSGRNNSFLQCQLCSNSSNSMVLHLLSSNLGHNSRVLGKGSQAPFNRISKTCSRRRPRASIPRRNSRGNQAVLTKLTVVKTERKRLLSTMIQN